MRPGEVSCAHRGVLFIDELAEYHTDVLDMLRQPLEDGQVLVCRARASVTFPARVLLVAAMNPCPCGGGGPGACRCRAAMRARYVARVSGPLLDRFDLRIILERPEVGELMASDECGESTATIAARVASARRLASERGVIANAYLPSHEIDRLAPLEPAAARFLEVRLRQGALSARGLHRVRRVARTIADLEDRPGALSVEDVHSAFALRADVLRVPVSADRYAEYSEAPGGRFT